MKKISRYFSIVMAISLLTQEVSLMGAYSAAPGEGSGPQTHEAVPPAAPASGPKEPLIEVSVDSLEITENNQNTLGFLWGDAAPPNNQINFIESGNSMPGIFDFSKLNRNLIQARLDALISNNQIRVLANPTLMTKSGFEATFLVGGEIPYPTPAPVGQSPGVEFKKYGVTLKILPQITPRQTIEAQINVGVSNPNDALGITIGGTKVPALDNREAGSKVEVRDGETLVMAGIKSSRRDKTLIRVPILGSIPLLGLLFRHKDEKVTQTSLVLFVTFRLVKPS